MKPQGSSLKIVLTGTLLTATLGGVGRPAEASPQKQPAGKPAETQRPAAALGSHASDADKALYSRITARELGDVVGKVELRDQGILIHPGEKTPTSVTFRLGGTFHRGTFRFLMPLDDAGKAVPEAGNVNVEFLLDGKSAFKTYVDRNSKLVKTVDLSGVQNLIVRVDNANGKSWWDWFHLSVVSLK